MREAEVDWVVPSIARMRSMWGEVQERVHVRFGARSSDLAFTIRGLKRSGHNASG